MNANELADELEAFHVDPDGFPYMVGEAVTMLRQQQSRILELECCINDCYTVQKMQAYLLRQQQAEIDSLKCQLAQAQRVYDFDNPLLDKGQEK